MGPGGAGSAQLQVPPGQGSGATGAAAVSAGKEPEGATARPCGERRLIPATALSSAGDQEHDRPGKQRPPYS